MIQDTLELSQRLRFVHDLCSFSILQVPEKKFIGDHDFNVLSFISNYIFYFILFNVYVQVKQCVCYFCTLYISF